MKNKRNIIFCTIGTLLSPLSVVSSLSLSSDKFSNELINNEIDNGFNNKIEKDNNFNYSSYLEQEEFFFLEKEVVF